MIIQHLSILPVLIPLSGALIALLLRKSLRFQGIWALITLLISLSTSVWLLIEVLRRGVPLVFQVGSWSAPFGISFVADPLAGLFVVMIQLVMLLGIVYALGSQDQVVRYPTFYPLFLTLTTGLTGTMLTGDLFNMFVFAELLVISGTVLTALSDDRYGAEAAYKYFYISLLASTSMLLSVGCLYVSYGTLNMADLAAQISQDGERLLLLPGVALLLVTFMIKSAVFPFHFWQPDFHTASSTPVSAMLSSVVVKLGVYGFLRMNTLLFVEQRSQVQGVLLALGVVGILFGGLSAIGTKNVKRMFAYSTLAQVGFILVGIGWGTIFSVMAAIVFAFNHSLVKAAMLMLSGYMASRLTEKSAAFEAIAGLGKSFPAAGILFFTGALALAGIPPTNGFVSKMLLFSSGIQAERFGWLLLIGLASILTIIYVIRAFGHIWWQQPALGTKSKPVGDQLFAPLVLILFVLLLGIWAEPLVYVANEASIWLSEPSRYILAVLGGGG
jgi:multicomponent Na+:H+ antiporter subunit D